MQPHAVFSAVVGGLLVVWLSAINGDVLERPIVLTLLLAMTIVVASASATYQWRTPLLIITTAVASGLVLGLGIAVGLLEPTITLWGSAVAFSFAGLGAVWASHRRSAGAPRASGRRSDHVGSPAA